jgi:hypothetical protein
MTQEQSLHVADLDERTRRAIAKLKVVIIAGYPASTCELTRAADDARSLHLLPIADVDDPDRVGDLVIDQVVALQVDEGIPIHVSPLRTPERVPAALAADSSSAA